MPSTETGHAKNAVNLQSMITYLQSLDGKYNPTKSGLKLENLKIVLTNANKSLDDYSSAKLVYGNAVDAQEAAFKPLDKVVTRVVNSYKASVDDAQSADAIITLKRKMGGSRLKKAAPVSNPDSAKPAGTHNTSHRSYDQRLESFSEMIKILESTPAYQPSEADLKITSLKALQADLLLKTQAVDVAKAPVINTRMVRNKILYDQNSGLYDLTVGARDYVLSVYGAGSAPVKYLGQLKFKKPFHQ